VRLFFTLLFLGLLVFQSRAGHLVGGEIYYECLGGSEYVITLKIYRDCNGVGAPFDNQASIAVYRSSNSTLLDLLTIDFTGKRDTLPFTQNIPCLVDTPDICIETTLYTDTFTIEVPLGGADVVYQRCCRPPNVINIDNVAQIGSTYHAFIPDSTVAPCNSSPYFNEVAPTVLCAGIYLELDYSVTDNDSDSIVYSFCRPYGGGSWNNPQPVPPQAPPFNGVPWASTYSNQHQITALPPLEIDSSTGIITGRPTQLGTYAFAVCAEEWRDGVLLSTNKRDFQLTTASCEVDAAAAIDSVLEECIGFEIQFFNLSTLGSDFWWDFGDSTTFDDTSSIMNPSYTYTDTGMYNIMLVSYGAVCTDTHLIEYRVQHKIEPFFEPPEPDCLDRHKYFIEPEGFYRSTTKIHWDFGDTILVSNSPETIGPIRFDSVGYHTISLSYEDLGCWKTYVDSVKVWPNPDVGLIDPPVTECAPLRTELRLDTTFAFKPHFYWFLDSAPVAAIERARFLLWDPGSYSINLRMITDSLCKDTVDKSYPNYITVVDTPISRFSMSTHVMEMYHPNFVVFDESENAETVLFSVDDDFLTSNRTHSFSLLDTGNYKITQIAIHDNLCRDSTNQFIRVEPQYLFFAPNSFTPNDDGINDQWLPSVFVHHDYKLEILDRWGRLVFQTLDTTYGWNGRKWNGGKPCPGGAYTYKAFVVDNLDKQWFYTGSLFLYR
jgi:gliding motility-associated-like protein